MLARRFNTIAWPAFGVLFVTGLWNLAVVSKYHRHDTAWGITLFVKLVIVALSGIRRIPRTRRSRAPSGWPCGVRSPAPRRSANGGSGSCSTADRLDRPASRPDATVVEDDARRSAVESESVG